MDFRTDLRLRPNSVFFSYQQSVITTGSCFAFSMGKRLADNKFQVLNCPFGTVYNPISIHRQLLDAINDDSLYADYFFHDQGEWKNVMVHSSFNDPTRAGLEKKILNAQQHTRKTLLHSHWLIITYGSAFVYELSATGRVVANCQKLPGYHFRKRLLLPEEIVSSFDELVQCLQTVRPELNLMITLSPVRHIRDSLALNQVSKSVVRYALHQITEKYPAVSYFPSYEIMLDDLRDYRFYEADLIHPNSLALDYIWGKFTGAYMDDETRNVMRKWQAVAAGLKHKPFAPQSAPNKQRLENLLRQLTELSTSLNVEDEMADVTNQINF